MPPPDPALVARLRAAGCVFAEDEARLLLESADGPAALERLVRRRVDGVPLEQVLGWAEFAGLRIAVEPGVFVPRRRTELLVAGVLARSLPPGAVVVDLCCGSGAVGVALVAARPRLELHAADVDPAAVEVRPAQPARRGRARGRPVRRRCRSGSAAGSTSWWRTRRTSRPARSALMPPEARDHEPRTALDGGGDGVDVHRRVAAGAPDWLAPDGWLLVETSEEQAPATASAFTAAGLVAGLVVDAGTGGAVVRGSRTGVATIAGMRG